MLNKVRSFEYLAGYWTDVHMRGNYELYSLEEKDGSLFHPELERGFLSRLFPNLEKLILHDSFLPQGAPSHWTTDFFGPRGPVTDDTEPRSKEEVQNLNVLRVIVEMRVRKAEGKPDLKID
jgi:hypothetical protein